MKVLIVNKFLYPNGGSETYIFKIGKRLSEMGHTVEYFGMEHEGNIVGNKVSSYTEEMAFTGTVGKLDKLKYPFKIIYSFDSRKKIRAVLDSLRPDVVHLNNINFQITPSIIDEVRAWERKNGQKVRIVSTAHDSMWVCPNHLMKIPSSGELCQRCVEGSFFNCTKYRCIHDSTMQSLIGSFEAAFYKIRHTYRLVDTVICPSMFLNNTLSHNPDLNGKTVTLHNFIDKWGKEDSDEPISPEVDKVLARKSPYVLYFGRYDWEKGINTLISVCKRLPEVDFVFAGRGDLEAEVNTCSNITNVGFQTGASLVKLIASATFTVFPSEWYENCPFTVMESEMYGTPVIASRLGGTTELVDEGVSGDLFLAGDPDDLLDKIYRLWNDDERLEKYRLNCREIAEGRGNLKFDNLDEYCHKLVEIYKR